MKRPKHLFIPSIAVLLGIVMLLVAGSVLAQQSQDQLPPHVIDVWPYPGEEVPVDQPVTVTFDQAMDTASVESAWKMEPDAPGQFTWLDDALSFIPDGGWQRATRYEITIGTEATSAAGLALEEAYSFHVQTVGYLEVSAVIPAPDVEGVAADATITVSFNRPVVPLVSTEELGNLPRPLTFEPDIDGTGEWVNTSIYVFTPRQLLNGGTTYTISVPAGLTDVTGAVLAETYSWQFKTLAPEILNVSPYQGQENVRLETSVSVEFSQPMSLASTEEAFMLLYAGERVRGQIEWSNNDRTLTFKTETPLKIESVYTISVAPTARGASGEATLKEGITYTFSTVPYPGIEGTYPENGDRGIEPGGGVSIYFKSAMNTDTFKGKAEIVEPAGVEWEPVVQGSSSLYLNFATQPNTTYTITFKKGAEDVYGNAIETDYTFSFQTGEREPWAWLPVSSQFVITSAYREDTRLAMSVSDKPTVGFMLYRVDESDTGLMMDQYYYEDVSAAVKMTHLVRSWNQELDAGPAGQGIDEVLLASEEGGRLPLGLYFLQADLPNYTVPEWLALGVVTSNVTLKRTHNEMLVWVTDIESAEPVANATVRLFTYDGGVFASGQTDADGLFYTPVDVQYGDREIIYAIAESDGVYGIWWSWGEPYMPEASGYVYTDRPIYRPDQTVYFRGAIRDREDVTYSLPPADTVHVTINVNWGSQLLLDEDIPLTEFGTFNGEVELPEDVELGQGIIAVSWENGGYSEVYFTISEFRVPEYKVEVAPDYDTIIQGDPLKAIAAASYYFGGPVSSADLSWTAYGQTAWFNYTGPGYYNFSDETQGYFDWAEVGRGSEQTDASGQVIINAPNTNAPSIRPMSITVEAEVVDESGQYISGRTTVMAHPANAYVGMRTDRYFGREKTPMNIDLIAVTPDSEPLADQKIELKVIEIHWERIPIEGEFGRYDWERQEIEIETAEVRTGSDGTAQYTFTPPQAGIYRLRATTLDERERLNSSTLCLWVTGEKSVWWGRPSDSIDLIADRDSYVPGDMAEVLIPIPFSGVSYVLVTVERADIQQYEVFRVEGSTLVYKLPITDDHAPTIHISATLMKGMDEENLNPSYRVGTIALDVTPVNRLINVTITPSATRAQPGDEVSFDVKTTDAHGEPVSAEVGLTLTDLAILSLMPPNSVSLQEHFYGYQYNNVNTNIALESLLDVMTDEFLKEHMRDTGQAVPAEPGAMDAVAMGAVMLESAEEEMAAEGAPDTGLAQVTIREDFQQTPLWAPSVVTDVTGQASVSVTLPDNLTTWHLDARGLTVDTQVGDAELDVMSTLPLLTRPVAPRFMVVGDRVTLASVINNNTDAAQEVEATLQATGVTLESDVTQRVTIEAGQRARVEWLAVVEDVPYVDLTFFAIGQDGYQDATKPTLATGPDGTIPVYRYTAPDTVGTGGVLREGGARTEAISLPPRLDVDQGELTIHLDPSLAVTTVDALNYLKNYKHQCIEQTISRFLPNVMTYRALKDLGLDDPELRDNLLVVLNEALDKLAKEQNPDGGWGWFRLMESNPYITAYAALGLIEARDAGFEVDQNMLDRALNSFRADLRRLDIDTSIWRLNRQAFYLYVLARDNQVQKAELDALLDQRLEMDYWALSFLLMAYNEFDPADPAVAQLVSDLQTAAILSATGAHWEEEEMDWWNWSSDTRTTALVLNALTRVQPDNEILPNAVRWLMVAREGDHWTTTQETAWAVMALTDWMVATGELRGNYDYALTLNGNALTEGTVTPDTVREGEVLRVEVKELLRDEINRLTVIRGEGDGALYYTAHLNVRLWASEAKAISRGITVSREFYMENQPDMPINQARVGDVITVRLTINLPQDIYYFVLEDPIPAGTEPLDTSLLTTSQLVEAPTIRPAYNPHWYWGWWLFDHTEMRDEQVNLYADFLPRGTYVYTYQVRASIPGEFQTMPSHAYAFYFPEVFGRGEGMLFTVLPEED
ncbi:MAG: Ig-like domain-containing protein [Anaerolineae bacterium]|nr:Ig-like domain-containing protein [Anaerolineae bacterium]